MEQLPQVLVEDILERLGVKSLVRFRSVSKQWNSMITSRSFASRHLLRALSRDPYIFLGGELFHESNTYPTLDLHCSVKKVNYIPKLSRRRNLVVTGSCDGLVCIYDFRKVMYVLNPATRWCRFLPRAKIQQINCVRENLNSNSTRSFIGFGKDTMTSKYKMVWLYNSLQLGLGLDGQTTCEVFDFTTNTWKHVTGSPHRICEHSISHPVYLDGSLHWFTAQLYGKTKIICFDLHTEVFQVILKIPIPRASPHRIIMFSLNNHLCVSEMKSPGSQEIWSRKSHNVWERTYSLNLSFTNLFYNDDCSGFPISTVTVFDNTLLLYLHPITKEPSLVVEETGIGSHDYTFFRPNYFIPSLITI